MTTRWRLALFVSQDHVLANVECSGFPRNIFFRVVIEPMVRKNTVNGRTFSFVIPSEETIFSTSLVVSC